jgi:hypothetical protein
MKLCSHEIGELGLHGFVLHLYDWKPEIGRAEATLRAFSSLEASNGARQDECEPINGTQSPTHSWGLRQDAMLDHRFFRLEAHHWARGIPDDGVGIGSEPTQHFVQSSSSDDD